MRQALKKAFLVLASAVFVPYAFSYSVRDIRGTAFEFRQPPKVVTVSPSATQAVYAAGAGSCLLANSRYCDYPLEARGKPKIGGILDLDYEKIVSLKPDIVIMPDISDSRVSQRLESLGIKCFFVHNEGFEHIADDVRLIGKLFNSESESERAAAEFEKVVDRISREIIGAGKRALFMFFGNIAAGSGSYVDGIMKLMGLENCAAKSGRAWPALSREFILASGVEVLFVELAPGENPDAILAKYKNDPVWGTSPAIAKGNVCFVPREFIVVPSLRIVEAMNLMAEFLQKRTK